MRFRSSKTRAVVGAMPSDWMVISFSVRREALQADLSLGWTVPRLHTAMVAAGWADDQAALYLLFAGIGVETLPRMGGVVRRGDALITLQQEAWLRLRTKQARFDGSERLVGLAEIAECLGEPRQKIAVWRQRGKLPKSYQELAMGPVWWLSRIYEWLASGIVLWEVDDLCIGYWEGLPAAWTEDGLDRLIEGGETVGVLIDSSTRTYRRYTVVNQQFVPGDTFSSSGTDDEVNYWVDDTEKQDWQVPGSELP